MTLSLGLRAAFAASGLATAGLIAGIAAPAHAATTVIQFHGLHVVHDRATAHAYLPGTSAAFKAFAAREGASVRRQAAASGAPRNCVRQAGVIVQDYAQGAVAGYAAGDVGSCGGYAALWTNATVGATGTTAWRQVIGTQDSFYCPVLKRYHVPSALIGAVEQTTTVTCYSPKLKKELTYHQD